MGQIYKYLLKIASLDKNLLVRQKSRFASHVLENREALDLVDIYRIKP